jgi:multiple sugar transport system ATP-binding protein
MAGLRVKNLKKSFGTNTVVDNISFEVKEGEFCILLGPSGCGKSTILRLIAGLELQDEGEIFIGEKEVSPLTPKERDVAMVFQSYALYPHMTVYENMAFPLTIKKTPKQETRQKVIEAARLLNIEGLLDRKPAELSGGERQRVAIGRAIVRSPKIFLFDEPLSNLDAKLRSSMRVELAKLHQKLGTTMLYVTHDQTEAMTLGEKIILLEGGKIQQTGTPKEVYEKPLNLFAATFIGSPQINLIEGKLIAEGGKTLFQSERFSIELEPEEELKKYSGSRITIGIRPESLRPGNGPIQGYLEVIEHLGSETIIYLKSGDARLIARAPSDFQGKAGDRISLSVNPRKIHCFYNGTRISRQD